MPRLLFAVAFVLLAAAPLADSGRATLAFEFTTADQSEAVRLGDEADSAASVAYRQRPDGTSEIHVSVHTTAEADGIAYRGTADLSAVLSSATLTAGEADANARQSHATLATSGPITQTQRRIRATEARLRIDRVTEDEVHGSFWIHADRETEARVSGQFVAPRPVDL